MGLPVIDVEPNDPSCADYPYEFTFTAHIEAGDQTLTYTVTMENRGDEAMPISPGFHPYFAVAQRLAVEARVFERMTPRLEH